MARVSEALVPSMAIFPCAAPPAWGGESRVQFPMGQGLNGGQALPRGGSLEQRQGPDAPALGAEGGNKGAWHLATSSVQVTPVSGGQTPPPPVNTV